MAVEQTARISVVTQEVEGTIYPTADYNPEPDTVKLHNALTANDKVNEASIISILSRRTNAERQKIVNEYRTKFGKGLQVVLNMKLKGNVKVIVQNLLMTPDEYDARELSRAMNGLDSDEHTMLEILFTRSNKEMQAIQKKYEEIFKAKLAVHIKSETAGHFQNLMIQLCQTARAENIQQLNQEKARSAARELYNAGKSRWGREDSIFKQTILSQSNEQLSAIFAAYDEISTDGIEKDIEADFEDVQEECMLAIVQCVRNKQIFFANKLYKTTEADEIDGKSVYRLVITRTEKDMVQVKHHFFRNYNKSLGKRLSEKMSGNEEKILLALIGGA